MKCLIIGRLSGIFMSSFASRDTFKCKSPPFWGIMHISLPGATSVVLPGFICSNVPRDWTFIPLLWAGSVVGRLSPRCRSADFLQEYKVNLFQTDWKWKRSSLTKMHLSFCGLPLGPLHDTNGLIKLWAHPLFARKNELLMQHKDVCSFVAHFSCVSMLY